MGESSEFVIPVSTSQEIRQQSLYIERLFNVRLEFTSDLHTAQRTGIIWVKVTGQKDAQKLAEVYVKGLANPETTTSFLIPDNLIAIGSWNPQVLWHIQQSCGAVIRYQGNTNLLIQGSQLAVAQAVSTLDVHINTLNQQCAARQAVNFMPQNTGYYEQSMSRNQYHQGAISQSAATKPRYQTCAQQDVVAKGAHIAKTDTQIQGDLNAERADVASKSSDGRHKDLRTELRQFEETVPAQSREFAVKLGYTDNQIDEALNKLKTSANSPVIGEDALLQQLIALYPNQSPSFSNYSDGAVAQDSVTVKQQLLNATIENGQSNLGKKGLVKKDGAATNNLRHIVIDGSNVAMSHGNRDVFSCKGINICVDFFKQRGHVEITVFVPQWRKEASKPDRPIEDQHILLELEKERILVFTPSRRVNGRRVVCYDDRYIVKYAADNDGIIVSNDNFKDLEKENPEWKRVIEQRLLMYAFVKDVFMPPDDPLGRTGPKLDAFLKKGTQINPRLCPYGKRCTYGNKCKFYHPERGQNDNNSNNSTRNKQSGNENQQMETVSQRMSDITQKPKEQEHLLRATTPSPAPMSAKFRQQLKDVFPDSSDIIDRVIRENPNVTDVNKLFDCVLAHTN